MNAFFLLQRLDVCDGHFGIALFIASSVKNTFTAQGGLIDQLPRPPFNQTSNACRFEVWTVKGTAIKRQTPINNKLTSLTCLFAQNIQCKINNKTNMCIGQPGTKLVVQSDVSISVLTTDLKQRLVQRTIRSTTL